LVEQVVQWGGRERAVGGGGGREEAKVLLHREVRVEREGLGHVADAPLDLGVTGQDVEAGDRGTAGRGRQEAAQHLDGGGLAGAVRAEESEDLPSLDLQRQLGHRVERSEAAAEPLREDDRSGVTPWGDGNAHWGRFPRASPWRRLFGSAIDAMAYRRSRRPT